ncbi:MAG: pyruvate, phosphate dikinase [bacterium]|nr:pyruvate, phosphate dikinase [bacterium]
MSKRPSKKASTTKKSTTKKKVGKFVYVFTPEKAEGGRDDRNLLGGKGANLAEMCHLGMPVPPGFTLTTEVCTHFNDHNQRYPKELAKQVRAGLVAVEKSMKKRFGDPKNPLLVSVRSGARVSMPGMMDTVLNLGLNDTTVAGLAERSGNGRFAWDAYRRFVQMYGDVVLEVRAAASEEEDPFSVALDALKKKRRVTEDTDLTEDDLRGLVATYKAIIKKRTKKAFPEDPEEQLWGAITAVFRSWNNERAIVYRDMNHIPADWGTAVNVVAMVYGNMGETSGTGVAFTRDPASGEKRFYGEYLMNAQGEDVVAGIRTPRPIVELEKSSPKAFRELVRIQRALEDHYGDMQDLEFTIEDGRLFMLQCRAGKRTGFAAVRIAADMVAERRLTKEEALMRVEPEALNQLLQPVFHTGQLQAAKREGRVLTRGLNAGPGAACGRVVFNEERAQTAAAKGDPVLLVRIETSPEDIKGMQAACGILTARGGMTSHAALVARQMGKVCVAGAGELEIDYAKRRMKIDGKTIKEGDWMSLNGTTGEVISGQVATQPSEVSEGLFGKGAKAKKARTTPTFKAFQSIMRWADAVRTMKVRANADQPDQGATAIAFGAEGIGLCRTEHMFFGEGKLEPMRQMILAETPEARAKALKRLLPLQRRDFEGLFKAMGDLPVTIRTLDPPLHEFLPHEPKAIRELAASLGVTAKAIEAKMHYLAEQNPMLGHRGCRLGITYPEITRMQATAILEAACNVAKRTKKKPNVEIMIPLVGMSKELELQAAVVREAAEEVFTKKKMRVPFLVGTMIELPRAALTSERIAKNAEFFSFGTNDLTQTTYGVSRDDAGKFVPQYIDEDIMDDDPFSSLDVAGVGRLMRIASDEGRKGRPDIKLGICGEHGGDPRSVAFCQELGLEYVSCSPFRVPIARLAAAQAALR